MHNSKSNVTMPYNEWLDYVCSNFVMISANLDKPVYESYTLRQCLELCGGTYMETAMRNAVMHCVYTGDDLRRRVGTIMTEFFVC